MADALSCLPQPKNKWEEVIDCIFLPTGGGGAVVTRSQAKALQNVFYKGDNWNHKFKEALMEENDQDREKREWWFL